MLKELQSKCPGMPVTAWLKKQKKTRKSSYVANLEEYKKESPKSKRSSSSSFLIFRQHIFCKYELSTNSCDNNLCLAGW